MANVFWRGGAPAVRQVVTLTFAGTWAANDTYRFTIGTKDLTLTIGTDTTLAGIAAEFLATFNASDPLSPAPSPAFVRSSGGQQILEFAEVTASVGSSSAVVVLTGALGVPFTYASLATTAGSGDVTAATAIAATGPNFLSNPDNYLGGALPVSGDVLIFDAGNVSAIYALDYFRANSIELDVRIYGDWLGSLGLPPTNATGLYPEYRTRFFQWQTNPSTLEVLAGSSGSTNQGNLYIDAIDTPGSTIRILAARGVTSTGPTIFLNGSDATVPLVSLKIERGSVSLEGPDATSGSSKPLFADAMVIGVPGGTAADCTVYIGRPVRIAEGSSFVHYSGTVYCEAASDDGVDDCAIRIASGAVFRSIMQNYGSSPAMGAVTVENGGKFYVDGEAAIASCDCAGELNLTGGNATVTIVGDLLVYASTSLVDPGGRCVDHYLPQNCSPQDLATLQTGPGGTWTKS
jgi:hypothetical protein